MTTQNINQKYSGEHIVAIVKDHGNYIPTSTHEFGNPLSAMPLQGCSHPAVFQYAAKNIQSKESKSKTRILAQMLFIERLNSRIKDYGDNYQLISLYFGVNDSSAKPITEAIMKLRESKEVDLENLLK